MRKLIVSTYVTLDGVMSLDGDLAHRWHVPFFTHELATYAYQQLFAADALLLGRRTYGSFAASWPSVTDEQGCADRMHHLPKQVRGLHLPGHRQLDQTPAKASKSQQRPALGGTASPVA